MIDEKFDTRTTSADGLRFTPPASSSRCGRKRFDREGARAMRRRWISLWALGAVIALASVYGVATASALESGDTVQFMIAADANQPEPNDTGAPENFPEDFLVYRSASGTIDASGCVAGDRPVQSATLVDRGQDVGDRTVEVITTFQSGNVTTPVEPGTRVGNLSFNADCAIFVDGALVHYKRYSGTVK